MAGGWNNTCASTARMAVVPPSSPRSHPFDPLCTAWNRETQTDTVTTPAPYTRARKRTYDAKHRLRAKVTFSPTKLAVGHPNTPRGPGQSTERQSTGTPRAVEPCASRFQQ